MKNKTIELISYIYIAVFLVLMLNFVNMTGFLRMSLRAYSRYVYISGGVGLILYVATKIKNFKFSKYEIFVFILMLFACLSLISAIDIHTAIFGKIRRYEGLLVWLSYYIFILNAMNIKNKKHLYIIAIIISLHMIFNICLGLFQIGAFGKGSYHYLLDEQAKGFLGNSNFLGSLSTIFYGLTLGLFIKEDFKRKMYLFIPLILANLGVIINCAMSAFVTVIVINFLCLIQLIVLFIKKKEKAGTYLISLIVGMLSFVMVFFVYSIDRPKLKNDVIQFFSQTKDIAENKIQDNYGTGRIYIWKNTIEKIKEAPITGFGIDNYRLAFNSQLMYAGKIVDKAHNDYLQKALCEGVISSVIFVIFLLTIFFKGLLRKLPPIYYGLFLAFTCYSIQAFFNISFINVAPIYFIIIGLLLGLLKDKKEAKESRI